MAVSSGTLGFWGDTGSVTGATSLTSGIGQIKSISISGLGADEVDITNMSSTGQYEELIPGIKRAGQLDITAVYAKGDFKLLVDAIGLTNENWVITLADGATYASSGFLKEVGLNGETEDAVEATATIRFTGAPTVTTS